MSYDAVAIQYLPCNALAVHLHGDAPSSLALIQPHEQVAITLIALWESPTLRVGSASCKGRGPPHFWPLNCHAHALQELLRNVHSQCEALMRVWGRMGTSCAQVEAIRATEELAAWVADVLGL